MQLPIVGGKNLSRQRMSFPTDFAGQLNLVFIAFQRWQQAQVDSWVPLAENLSQELDGFAYYEFPTIQPMNILSRTFINEGMRAGIRDRATRERTVTLYLNKDRFRGALDIPHEDEIWVMLFDRQGQVLWRARGAFSPEKEKALRAAVSAARQPARI
jgi:hypothetical protein